MDLATFRATSKPVKRRAVYRELTEDERDSYLEGENISFNICTAGYLRMCVIGAENVADGLYIVEG